MSLPAALRPRPAPTPQAGAGLPVPLADAFRREAEAGSGSTSGPAGPGRPSPHWTRPSPQWTRLGAAGRGDRVGTRRAGTPRGRRASRGPGLEGGEHGRGRWARVAPRAAVRGEAGAGGAGDPGQGMRPRGRGPGRGGPRGGPGGWRGGSAVVWGSRARRVRAQRVGKVAGRPLLDAELVGPPPPGGAGSSGRVCAHPVRVSGGELAFPGKRGLSPARGHSCRSLCQTRQVMYDL